MNNFFAFILCLFLMSHLYAEIDWGDIKYNKNGNKKSLIVKIQGTGDEGSIVSFSKKVIKIKKGKKKRKLSVTSLMTNDSEPTLTILDDGNFNFVFKLKSGKYKMVAREKDIEGNVTRYIIIVKVGKNKAIFKSINKGTIASKSSNDSIKRVAGSFKPYHSIGVGAAYHLQGVSLDMPSIDAKIEYASTGVPLINLIAHSHFMKNWGTKFSYKSAPGEVKESDGNIIQGDDSYSLNYINVAALWYPDFSSNVNLFAVNWHIAFSLGMQMAQYPFVQAITATDDSATLNVSIQDLTYVIFGIVADGDISKTFSYEFDGRLRYLISAGTSDEVAEVSQSYSMDGFMGVNYTMMKKFKIGLFMGGEMLVQDITINGLSTVANEKIISLEIESRFSYKF